MNYIFAYYSVCAQETKDWSAGTTCILENESFLYEALYISIPSTDIQTSECKLNAIPMKTLVWANFHCEKSLQLFFYREMYGNIK